jgi:hypothetical protein
MNRSITTILAVATLAMACSRQAPVVTSTPAPTPFPVAFSFTATSQTDLAMEGTFEGTATYENGWLKVTVPKTTITVPPGNSENWRNLTVRSFVAANYGRGNWTAVAQSRPVNIFRFLNFGATRWTERRTLTLEAPLSFIVPVPPGATAENSRLAFELEWVFVMGSFGDTDSRVAISGPISATPPFP